MSKLRAVLVRDFDSLLRQRAGLFLALAVPLLALLLLGRQSDPPAVRVLVAGAPQGEKPAIDRLILVLKESAGLTVSTQPAAAADPLARLTRGRFDLLLNYEKGSAKDLSIYTAETEPSKLARLEQIGAGILRASAVIEARQAAEDRQAADEAYFQEFWQELPDPKPNPVDLQTFLFFEPRWKPLFDQVWWAQPALYEDLHTLGTFPIAPLFEYYPQAADPRVNALPAIIAVILGVFPFLLTFAQGRGGGPFEISGWRDAATLALGRSMVAAGITLVSFLLMLIVAESFQGVLIKAGIFRMLLLLLPASMAAAFLGLGLSRLARSPLAIASAGASYLLLTVLLGDAIAPLAERPALVQQLGRLLPSAAVQPALSGWIFGASFDWTLLEPLGWVLLQSLLYGAFATFALLRPAQRRIADPVIENPDESMDSRLIQVALATPAAASHGEAPAQYRAT